MKRAPGLPVTLSPVSRPSALQKKIVYCPGQLRPVTLPSGSVSYVQPPKDWMRSPVR